MGLTPLFALPHWTPGLTEDRSYHHRALGPNDVTAYERTRSEAPGPVYFVVSRSQIRYVESYGLLPGTAIATLEAELAASPTTTVFYRNGDATIYELPAPSSTSAGTPRP